MFSFLRYSPKSAPVISYPITASNEPAGDDYKSSSIRVDSLQDSVLSPESPFNNTWWWWELGAATLSLACTAAVVSTLLVFDGKSLASWPLPISINSLLSVFTTIAKTALLVVIAACISQLKWIHYENPQNLDDLSLFEDASRGPWGSLRFLLGLNIQSILGSWAALVTIAALGVDPSVQQILAFPSRNISTGAGFGSLGLTFGFDTGQLPDNGTISGVATVAPTTSSTIAATLAVHGATLDGLYGSTQPLPFDCPTSSCQWRDFTTFGLCSSCQDITNRVVQTEQHTTCLGIMNDLPWGCPRTGFNNFTLLNYSLPDSLHSNEDPGLLQAILPDPLIPNKHSPCYPNCNTDLMNPTVSMLNYTATPADQSNPDPLVNISNFMIVKGYQMKGSSSFDARPSLTECQLQWCAQTYTNVTSQNGKLYTSSPIEVPVVTVNVSSSDVLYQNVTSAIPYSNLTDFKIYIPDPNNLHQVAHGFENSFYLVNAESERIFSGFLTDLLTRDLFWDDAQHALQVSNFLQPQYTTSISETIYQSGINASLSALAKSVTQTLRTGRNSSSLQGAAISQETFIHVRWGWLVPTIVIVVATNLILAAAMWRTARHQRLHRSLMWKDSPLAYLFHGLEGWHGADLEVETLRQMERKGKGMQARLARNDTGDWKFIRAETKSF